MTKRREDAWTLRRLKEIYSYDPLTGIFTRKEKQRGGSKPGRSGQPGGITNNGYRLLSIDSTHHLAHRLAWAYAKGEWPSDAVSHANGDGLDNRIENLRLKWENCGVPLTQRRLQALLDYNAETGKFYWRVRTTRTKIGQEAGTVRSDNYCTISVDGHRELSHRLVWLYVHGHTPKRYIDHINGNPSDNRLVNLREATPSQNTHNPSGLRSNNTTGFRGVSHRRGKFHARISVRNRVIPLGDYDTAEEAYAARLIAEAKYLRPETMQ